MTTRLCLLMMFGLPVAAASQTVSGNRISQCENLLVSQMEAARAPNRQFNADLNFPAGGRLIYFGVLHTFDPADSQFVAMQTAWSALKPTMLFYEGTSTGDGDSASLAIQKFGEPGFARFLARKGGIPARSLEPTRAAEIDQLLTQFTAEQLVLFYALRPIEESRTRRGLVGQSLDSLLNLTLAQLNRNPRLKDVLPDTASFRAAFVRLFPGRDPTAVPSGWFDPLYTSAQSGSFFNDINRASSRFRDVYMYRQLAVAAQDSGARIFAEVGRDHIPAELPALKCVANPPNGGGM